MMTDSAPLLRILGVMTGTSCDGLDAACVEFDSEGWAPSWSASASYPAKLRKRVLDFQKPGTRLLSADWLDLNKELGEWYGKTIHSLIERHAEPDEPIDAIANHGQTVAHFPGKSGGGVTWQIGDPTRIASATGLTVISNFREGDLAARGQGAPLVPLFHKLVAAQFDPGGQGIAIHNIGGISNLTYIPSTRGWDLLAFDTGPGNIWIDAATDKVTKGRKKFDAGGALAAEGKVDFSAVRKLLRHPFFDKPPPKSTGRDEFPFALFLSSTKARGASLVATATAVTVESIGQAYERAVLSKKKPLSRILVCGGGARNQTLMNWLGDRLPGISVQNLDTATEGALTSQALEAQAFAYFGYLSLLGRPIGGPWTGARQFGPPGHIIPGENWAQVADKIAQLL